MKKMILTLLICSVALGCGSPLDKVRTANRKNLTRLSIGMTKTKAMKIMGKKTKGGRFGEALVNNPYKSEVLYAKGKTFEVVYYYTHMQDYFFNVTDATVSDDELTPLIFENNLLIGWGKSFLDATIEQYEIKK